MFRFNGPSRVGGHCFWAGRLVCIPIDMKDDDDDDAMIGTVLLFLLLVFFPSFLPGESDRCRFEPRSVWLAKAFVAADIAPCRLRSEVTSDRPQLQSLMITDRQRSSCCFESRVPRQSSSTAGLKFVSPFGSTSDGLQKGGLPSTSPSFLPDTMLSLAA